MVDYLFLIMLKEPSGILYPKIQETICASKSGKLTSNHFETLVREVYFPNIGRNLVLLLDRWIGHCPDIYNSKK